MLFIMKNHAVLSKDWKRAVLRPFDFMAFDDGASMNFLEDFATMLLGIFVPTKRLREKIDSENFKTGISALFVALALYIAIFLLIRVVFRGFD